MEIIVGREEHSRRLCVVRDGKPQLCGQPGSVPMDVSRQHLRLHLEREGKWNIQNLNAQNVTYVNGLAVESKVISESDRLELGKSHYLLSWDFVRGPKVETVDIRPLKRVWDWFDSTQVNLKEDERRAQNIGRLSGILSSCGILFMFVESLGFLRYVLTGISVIISVYFFIRGNSPDSSLNIKMNELSKEFRKRYTCPKCGHFMGNEPYDVLIQNESCRFCKAKFKK